MRTTARNPLANNRNGFAQPVHYRRSRERKGARPTQHLAGLEGILKWRKQKNKTHTPKKQHPNTTHAFLSPPVPKSYVFQRGKMCLVPEALNLLLLAHKIPSSSSHHSFLHPPAAPPDRPVLHPSLGSSSHYYLRNNSIPHYHNYNSFITESILY